MDDVGVPMCDVQGQYRSLQNEIEAAVLRVLRSGWVILGPDVAALEEEIAEYCQAAHAVACGSGTDALSLALHAVGIGPGDEVILPTFTFFATVGSVCRTGATPVLVDIDADTYNLDPQAVAAAVTSRTRAILPVHLYGQTAEMQPLWEIAQRHGLTIIEDAAQAIGSEYQGRRTGVLGDLACLSFYPSKNLSCCGEGGMVVTQDERWARRMAVLRVHGMEPKYHHRYIGWNSRLDTVQAAILRVKLPHLERWIAARQAAAARYDAIIQDSNLADVLARPIIAPHRRHTFNQYVVRVRDGHRDGLLRHLQSKRIGCDIYYPIPLHRQECLAHLGYREGDFPVAEKAAREVLALPLFPEITAEQQEKVIGACAEYFNKIGCSAA